MCQFPKNLYFSLVAEKITSLFKVTVESIYTIRVYHVVSHHWLPIHHGSGICGNEVHSGFRGSGVRGSPRAN